MLPIDNAALEQQRGERGDRATRAAGPEPDARDFVFFLLPLSH
jgi:hypothetical protein